MRVSRAVQILVCKQCVWMHRVHALRCHCGKVLLKSGSCDTPGQDVSVGVPSVLQHTRVHTAAIQ
jgi:hypothetical protein